MAEAIKEKSLKETEKTPLRKGNPHFFLSFIKDNSSRSGLIKASLEDKNETSLRHGIKSSLIWKE